MAAGSYETVDDLRKGWQGLRERLEQTRLHIDRMLREYSTLEDEINELEKALDQTKKELGLTSKEIITPEIDEIDKLLEDL